MNGDSKLSGLDPSARAYAYAFISYLRSLGLKVTVTSGLRTRMEQQTLYQRAQRGGSRYPAAPPGHSLHETGLAWDMVVEPREYLAAVGHAWEQLGGRWGGRFKDPVHFDFLRRS